ncbi:polar amino acid ABC transporter, inner membrane subunit [Gloeothece citriformis PCC 7424]|uniref:Polar amino acid ABC transporter, inner membrane subunit n=1 Tax=Gloeothece citriformis (strain PCC 7424) TaxID=65393 RepID=B7KFY3_GLOC7|nr:amino acid ABC transporter permease [Gloeothece citriformis]ACK69176.1 polar amino acid ABC transporter, inner membrane subunit [Gloeothece citriformis PCC 7424]
MSDSLSPSYVSPPIKRVSPGEWIHKNLFSSWFNGFLTLISLLFIGWVGFNLIDWIFTEAQWQVITANLRLFFVGYYPIELLWRTWISLGILVSLGGLSWGIFSRQTLLFNRTSLMILFIFAAICVFFTVTSGLMTSLILWGMLLLLILCAVGGKKLGQSVPSLGTWLGLIWLGTFLIVWWLLRGGLFLDLVPLSLISGLILTLSVAIVSIVLSFPFGVLLALGRQSSLPVIRWLSIAYIELIRGFPLIGILFMAQVMLPLVLPLGVRPDSIVRAIAGFTLFSAAYLAENVRGGLQSVPRGQTEAAKALGLNPLLVLSLIVLPQALKAVIPTLVGQFISLFKDTSLLAIVGLVDLLGISQSILANPKYQGRNVEVYLFIGFMYWLCCSAMSLASRKIETKMSQ